MSPVRTAPFPDPEPLSDPQPCPLAEQMALAEQLHQRLLTLDYPQFARCICRLLEALGYEHARLAGRRLWKGYNRPGGGGYDIEAILPGGLAPRRVIAQIKQFESLAVHQRTVDELRGACLRTGAAEGLLVTTSAFSEVVRRRIAPPSSATSHALFGTSDLCGSLAVPVRLIDGQELLGLLIHYRIGVRECVGIQKYFGKYIGTRTSLGSRHYGLVGRSFVLDEAFFATLSSVRSNPTQSNPTQSKMPKSGSTQDSSTQSGHSSASPRWRMTVRIFPVYSFPVRIFWGAGSGTQRGKQTGGDGESNDDKNDERKKGGDPKSSEQKNRQKKGSEQKGGR